jgi:hypothetical protein
MVLSLTDLYESSKRWEVFYKCFPRVCRTRLMTPSNGMMLLDFLHTSFRMFDMAFVKTVSPCLMH